MSTHGPASAGTALYDSTLLAEIALLGELIVAAGQATASCPSGRDRTDPHPKDHR
jgi:hypothetical protein